MNDLKLKEQIKNLIDQAIQLEEELIDLLSKPNSIDIWGSILANSMLLVSITQAYTNNLNKLVVKILPNLEEEA